MRSAIVIGVGVGLVSLLGAGSTAVAQPLGLGADPDAPISGPSVNQSRIAFSDIAIASAMAPGDEILVEPSFGLGLLTPYVDGGLVFGFASAPLLTGKRRAITLTPTVGHHLAWENGPKEIYHLYGTAQLPIQWRYGASLDRETGYGIAAEIGGRMWICSARGQSRGTCAGLTIGVRYRRHLSEYQVDNAVLPAGSSMLSVPVSISFATRID